MATFRCGICEAFNEVEDAAAEPRCIGCESKLDLSGKPQEVDGPALERAIALSPVPVLVDFWASWCGPCLMSAPVVKALGSRLAGEIVVVKVNTEDAPEAGETHAIYAIPTFAVFQRGEEVSRQMGLLPVASSRPGCVRSPLLGTAKRTHSRGQDGWSQGRAFTTVRAGGLARTSGRAIWLSRRWGPPPMSGCWSR